MVGKSSTVEPLRACYVVVGDGQLCDARDVEKSFDPVITGAHLKEDSALELIGRFWTVGCLRVKLHMMIDEKCMARLGALAARCEVG
jgi:hypothetical protein